MLLDAYANVPCLMRIDLAKPAICVQILNNEKRIDLSGFNEFLIRNSLWAKRKQCTSVFIEPQCVPCRLEEEAVCNVRSGHTESPADLLSFGCRPRGSGYERSDQWRQGYAVRHADVKVVHALNRQVPPDMPKARHRGREIMHVCCDALMKIAAAQGQSEPAVDFQASVGNDVLSFRLSVRALGSSEVMAAMPAKLTG